MNGNGEKDKVTEET